MVRPSEGRGQDQASEDVLDIACATLVTDYLAYKEMQRMMAENTRCQLINDLRQIAGGEQDETLRNLANKAENNDSFDLLGDRRITEALLRRFPTDLSDHVVFRIGETNFRLDRRYLDHFIETFKEPARHPRAMIVPSAYAVFIVAATFGPFVTAFCTELGKQLGGLRLAGLPKFVFAESAIMLPGLTSMPTSRETSR